MPFVNSRRILGTAALLAVTASAQPDPSITTVALVGDLQTGAAACASNWDPTCTKSFLTAPTDDTVWRRTFTVPAGSWNWKVALNGGWTQNYGINGSPNGPNMALNVAEAKEVTFFWDEVSKFAVNTHTSNVVTVAGTFQSELGCKADDSLECMRAFLIDLTGSGSYQFTTKSIPAATYTAYPVLNAATKAGNTQIDFTVPSANSTVTFTYDSHTLLVAVNGRTETPCSHLPGAPDGCLVYDDLTHNTRNDAFRTPQGAVHTGTPVKVRLQTRANDVSEVSVVYESLDPAGRNGTVAATRVVGNGTCFQITSEFGCDIWEATVSSSVPTVIFYHFVVKDGEVSAVYGDDAAFDNALGQWATSKPLTKFGITVYPASFGDNRGPSWHQNAVVYQIFPDRFRNGDKSNDPTPDVKFRYSWNGPSNKGCAANSSSPACGNPADAERTHTTWSEIPEGACQRWKEGCGSSSPAPSFSRDWYGGDLDGVVAKLPYLKALGVDIIWFNPIFDAASNHLYDTRDYMAVHPYFGGMPAWTRLQSAATRVGIKLVLDGVFNHVSSDSSYFDKFGHYNSTGACESVESPYRSWFMFNEGGVGSNAPCAGPNGPNTMFYHSFFGYDTLPTLNKSDPGVRDLVFAPAKAWLKRGAKGWRLDAAASGTYDATFWPAFRKEVYSADPDTFLVAEAMVRQDCLPMMYGTKVDSAMNYRFRDAVQAFLQPRENGGMEDPVALKEQMESLREDYSDRTYYTLWNLVDSHDFPRFLWTLTPGPDTRAAKEWTPSALAVGKKLLTLAHVMSYTVPGLPTVYY
ncbi:hypothetical protein HK104_000524, partial [Borealophlyctis nickersoniae]